MQTLIPNMLPQAESKKLIHELKFSNKMSIIHLLFAEDGIIFTRAKTKDYTKLKHIFDSYTAVSGQIFNYEKSSMFFNKKHSS